MVSPLRANTSFLLLQLHRPQTPCLIHTPVPTLLPTSLLTHTRTHLHTHAQTQTHTLRDATYVVSLTVTVAPAAWPDSERRLTRQSGFNPTVTEWRDTRGGAGWFCVCVCGCMCVCVCVVLDGGIWVHPSWHISKVSSSGGNRHHGLVFLGEFNVVCCRFERHACVHMGVWSGTRARWQMEAGKLCLVNIITGQRAQILSGSWTVVVLGYTLYMQKENKTKQKSERD